MEYGAIDLHLKASLIRIVDADGAVVVDRTIATTRVGPDAACSLGACPAAGVGREWHRERVGGADGRGCAGTR